MSENLTKENFLLRFPQYSMVRNGIQEDELFPEDDTDRLRAKLWDMIESIEGDIKTNGCSRRNESFKKTTNDRSHLDNLLNAISAKRAEIEKQKQSSSFRVLNDEIAASKKDLEDLQVEIHSLEKEAQCQMKTLAAKKGSALMNELEKEVAHQRRLNAELRRENTEIERELRTRQRICGRLEEQCIKSSRNTSRVHDEKRIAIEREIELFTEELYLLESEVELLRQESA